MLTCTLDVSLRAAVSLLLQKTSAEGVAVATAQAGLFVCRVRSGRIAPNVGTKFSVDSGAVGSCIRTANLIHCRDTQTEGPATSGIRSLLVAPISNDGAVVGLIEVLSSRPQAFQPFHVTYLEAIAEWVGDTCDCADQSNAAALPQWSLPVASEVNPGTECTQPHFIAAQDSKPDELQSKDPGIAAFQGLLDEMPGTATWEDICQQLVPRFKA